MAPNRLTARLAASPFASIAAMPVRVSAAAKYNGTSLAASARWLIRSREHTNYTYDLTRVNIGHLAWHTAAISGVDVATVYALFRELESDCPLREAIRARLATHPRRRLADGEIRYNRRLEWYALIRILRPKCVVECGVDKGLGATVSAAALLRNAADGFHGMHIGLDFHPDAGYLLSDPYRRFVKLMHGDVTELLPEVPDTIDLFLLEIKGSEQFERRQLDLAAPSFSDTSVILSPNVTDTTALQAFAEESGRKFLTVREIPEGHWYPGETVGAAW